MFQKTFEEKALFERIRFISALLLYLARYPSELEAGSMNNFYLEDGRLWWKVHKEDQVDKIPVPEKMHEALRRYRAFLGLTTCPLSEDTSPLLRSIKNNSGISVRRLNVIFDELFEKAAKLLEIQTRYLNISPMEASELMNKATRMRKASPDWLRLTSIFFEMNKGHDISAEPLLEELGNKGNHVYDYIDDADWHEQMQKFKPLQN